MAGLEPSRCGNDRGVSRAMQDPDDHEALIVVDVVDDVAIAERGAQTFDDLVARRSGIRKMAERSRRIANPLA